MESKDVGDIYDTLFEIESNFKTRTYPVHKKLNFRGDSQVKDIYEWLFEKIDFPQKGKILDVGCGAGFGSFFMADNTNCQITGISLSDKEVKSDNEVAKERGLEDRVKFLVKNFDEPFSEKYDLMVAVESVKHSFGLDHTMKNLTSALKPGGKLIIVEDFLQKNADNRYVDVMAEDYSLFEVYKEEDYTNPLGNDFEFKTHDLTPYTLMRSTFQLYLRYYGSELLTFIGKLFGKGKFWQVMRGGLALEFLYYREEMTYEVLEIDKK